MRFLETLSHVSAIDTLPEKEKITRANDQCQTPLISFDVKFLLVLGPKCLTSVEDIQRVRY